MAPGSRQGSLYETSVVLSRETNIKSKKKKKKERKKKKVKDLRY